MSPDFTDRSTCQVNPVLFSNLSLPVVGME